MCAEHQGLPSSGCECGALAGGRQARLWDGAVEGDDADHSWG